MPLVSFDSLADDSRVWVFGSSKPLNDRESALLLARVDEFLAGWKAHGEPLTAARMFSSSRFLTIAVDQKAAHASGGSIDGLFRSLKELELQIGASLVDRSLVYYSDEAGTHSVHRDEFTALAANGSVHSDTTVFDPTVTLLGEWRARFHSKAANSWHSGLFPTASV